MLLTMYTLLLPSSDELGYNRYHTSHRFEDCLVVSLQTDSVTTLHTQSLK